MKGVDKEIHGKANFIVQQLKLTGVKLRTKSLKKLKAALSQIYFIGERRVKNRNRLKGRIVCISQMKELKKSMFQVVR